jgi:hypothetical protein
VTPEEISAGGWVQTSRKYKMLSRPVIDEGLSPIQMLEKVDPDEFGHLFRDMESRAREILLRHSTAERIELSRAEFDAWLISTGRVPGPSECPSCFAIEKSSTCSKCGNEK